MIINQALWRRQYRHESAEHKNWDLVVRGVRDLLMRLPEALDGVILKQTTDPVADLLGPMSVKPKDRRSFKAAIELLLKDGFIVHTDNVLLIRNFRPAQTGSNTPDVGESPAAMATSRAVTPELSAARAEAGRLGGLKAQASKQLATSKPEQTGKQNPEQTEQVSTNKVKQVAPARDPEDQRREEKNTKEKPQFLKTHQVLARGHEATDGGAESIGNDETARVRCPGNLADALLVPIAQRCRLVLEDPHQGSFCQVQEWPEIQAVARSFESVFERAPTRFGGIRQDAGLRAILERLAEGHSPVELTRAIAVATTDEWFRKAPRGLSSFTPEVVRRLLEKAAPRRQQARPPIKAAAPEDDSKYSRCPPGLLAGLGVKRAPTDAADDVKAILEAVQTGGTAG